MTNEQREPNPAAVPESQTEQAAESTGNEDDSFLDDMIESIVEIPAKAVHWLFRPLWGGKDNE
jgi:hypothetical protein